MPLITKLLPELDRARLEVDGKVLKKESDNQSEDEYFQLEEGEEDDIDMNGNSVLHRGRPKKPVPDLPPKSQLRASKILDGLTVQLDILERAAFNDSRKSNVDPHEQYLSSEEETSESADEYDDSVIELDSDRPSSSASFDSYEEVARVVSMFVGKPTMISISLTKPSQNQRPLRRPAPLQLSHSALMASLPPPPTSRSSSPDAPTDTPPFTTINNTTTAASKSKPLSHFAPDSNFLFYDPYPAAEAREILTPPASPTTLPSTRYMAQTSTSNLLAKERGLPTPTSESPISSSWSSSLNQRFAIPKSMRKPSTSNLSKLNSAFSSSTQLLTFSPVTNEEFSIGDHDGTVSESDSSEGRYEDVMRGISRVEGKGGKSGKVKSVGLGNGFGSNGGKERKRNGFVELVNGRGMRRGLRA